MLGNLSQIPRYKRLVGLLLIVGFLTACDQAKAPIANFDKEDGARQNSGNRDDPVDTNNPLLNDETPQNTKKGATKRSDSRGEGRGASPKSSLVAACAQDTIVMGYGKDGKVRRTGSNINGYCEGYLLAAYESMLLAGALCRDDTQPPSAYFLRSVFQEHAKANLGLSRDDAKAVADAFLDAFSCKRSRQL